MRQFSSVQSLDRMGHRGDMKDDSAEIFLQSFLQKALVSCSGMGKGCTLFDVVHPALFPLPTTASPTLRDAPKDGVGQAVGRVTCPNYADVT